MMMNIEMGGSEKWSEKEKVKIYSEEDVKG